MAKKRSRKKSAADPEKEQTAALRLQLVGEMKQLDDSDLEMRFQMLITAVQADARLVRNSEGLARGRCRSSRDRLIKHDGLEDAGRAGIRGPTPQDAGAAS